MNVPGAFSIPASIRRQPAVTAPVLGFGGGSSRLDSALAAVARQTGVDSCLILGKSRRRGVADARRLAIFAAHTVEPGLPFGKLAAFFRVSRTYVPVALRKHRQLAQIFKSIARHTASVLEALQTKGNAPG